MDVFDRAIRFAAEAHSGMVRRGENAPYILHPMEVASIVGTMTGDREILAAIADDMPFLTICGGYQMLGR